MIHDGATTLVFSPADLADAAKFAEDLVQLRSLRYGSEPGPRHGSIDVLFS